jgi:hypothetical protein
MTVPIGQPLRAGASVIDIMGAMFGVIAAQAALRERDLKAVDTCLPVEKVCSIDEMACKLMSTERQVPAARERATPAFCSLALEESGSGSRAPNRSASAWCAAFINREFRQKLLCLRYQVVASYHKI